MKGVVFREFSDLVETKFGIETLDRVLTQAELPSGGAYTSVGTYDHREMLQLVTALSAVVQVSAGVLVKSFGQYLFGRLARSFPALLAPYRSLPEFLEQVEGTIHREVRKLYRDAQLPTLQVRLLSSDRMEIIYRSTRPFADLAEGLLLGAAEHFGERVELERENLPGSPATAARFVLTFQANPARQSRQEEVTHSSP